MTPIEQDAANLALERLFKTPVADYLKGVPKPEVMTPQPSQLRMIRRAPQIQQATAGQGIKMVRRLPQAPPPITGELPVEGVPPQENRLKDIWDSLWTSFRGVGYSYTQYGESVLPLFLNRPIDEKKLTQFMPEMKPLGGPVVSKAVERVNVEAAANRKKALKAYEENRQELVNWYKKRPELLPRVEWDMTINQAVKTKSSVLKDWGFWVNAMTRSAAPTIASLIAGGAGTLIGGPGVGLATAFATMLPLNTTELYETLIETGASPERASELAIPIGVVLSALDAIGELPIINRIAPSAAKAFAKSVAKGLGKKLLDVGRAATETMISEVITENLQQIVSNAALNAVGANKSLFANLDETTLETIVSVLPFAGIGGALEYGGGISPATQEAIRAKIAEERGSIGVPEGQMAMPIEAQREQIARGQADLDMLRPGEVQPKTIIATRNGFVGTDAEGRAALVIQVSQEGTVLKAGNVVAREGLSKLEIGRLLKQAEPMLREAGIQAPTEGLSPQGVRIAEKYAEGQPPSPPITPPPTEVGAEGLPQRSPEELRQVFSEFSKQLQSDATKIAWRETQALRAPEQQRRFQNFSQGIAFALQQGKSFESAIQESTAALKGKYPVSAVNLRAIIPTDVLDSFYQKIYETLVGESDIEIAATKTAFDRAIEGGGVPMEPGTRGGSSYTRLVRVFGENSPVMQMLLNPEETISKVYPEISESSLALRELPTRPSGQVRLGETIPPLKLSVSKTKEQIAQETLLLDLYLLPEAKGVPGFKGYDNGSLGQQLAMAPLAEQRTVRQVLKKLGALSVEIVNIPRSIITAIDNSMLLRQLRRPIWGEPEKYAIPALKVSFGAMFSSEYAKEVDTSIKRNSFYHYAQDANLHLQVLEGATSREELILSGLVKKIPGLGVLFRASERAANTAVNKIRSDIFYRYCQAIEDVVFADPSKRGQMENWIKGAARLAEIETGRGSWSAIDKAMPALTPILFSPRYQLSVVQAPFAAAFAPSPIRKMAIIRSVRYTGTVLLTMTLLKLAFPDRVDIEDDPRSTDFGKIRIGDTRLDLTGAEIGWIRFLRQVTSGTKLNAQGEIIETNRWQIVETKGRSMLSPPLAFLVDMLKGQTMIGEELFETPQKELYNRLMPLFIQDMVDAMREDGITGALAATPGFFGVGVVSYPAKEFDNWVDAVKEGNPNLALEGTPAPELRGQLKEVFDRDMETLYPYYQLPKGEMRDNYITQNPEVEASLYFWGLKTEVTNPKTWGIVQDKLRQYGISEDSYPIRSPIEEWKLAGKTQEQLYSDLLTTTPKYLSDYIGQNRKLFQDVTTLVPKLQERKQTDQKLIDSYERAMVGADPELREAYRYDHPALDAALNLWGRVKTTQTSKADELLTQAANELGIPLDAIPALSTTGGFGTTTGFGRTVKRTYKRLRR